jgi:hypothetical protein
LISSYEEATYAGSAEAVLDKTDATPVAPSPSTVAGASLILKDMVDHIKNRLMIFMPFFGFFVVFLFNKSDYVMASTMFVQLLCAASFLGGLAYSVQVYRTIDAIETTRFVHTITTVSGRPFSQDEKVIEAVQGMGVVLTPMYQWETKLFKHVMRVLYFTAFAILTNEYFGKAIEKLSAELSEQIALWIIAHPFH